ncbi:hypothetical protein AB0J52_08290 [Spirillospora sp. NPDC049652]
MNVRAVVSATALALSLGAVALPAHAAPATCDLNSIKELTVEQVTMRMPADLRNKTRGDIIYPLLRGDKIKDLPAYYQEKIREACR